MLITIDLKNQGIDPNRGKGQEVIDEVVVERASKHAKSTFKDLTQIM